MSQLIMNALIKEAEAQEAKAVANLNNYMNNASGVGEHPDVVSECKKLIMDIAEAREMAKTIQTFQLVEENNNEIK